jgi:hypothetical protein
MRPLSSRRNIREEGILFDEGLHSFSILTIIWIHFSENVKSLFIDHGFPSATAAITESCTQEVVRDGAVCLASVTEHLDKGVLDVRVGESGCGRGGDGIALATQNLIFFRVMMEDIVTLDTSTLQLELADGDGVPGRDDAVAVTQHVEQRTRIALFVPVCGISALVVDAEEGMLGHGGVGCRVEAAPVVVLVLASERRHLSSCPHS